MWDELSSVIHPTKEILEIRKNILLYKIKHREKESCIQNVQYLQRLIEASHKLAPQIESLATECEQKDFLVRRKGMFLM